MAFKSTRYTWTKPPLGRPLDNCHPLTEGLIAAWTFAEGGGLTALDSVQNRTVTLNSTVGWSPQGADFNGSTSCGTTTSFPVGTEVSVAARVLPRTIGGSTFPRVIFGPFFLIFNTSGSPQWGTTSSITGSTAPFGVWRNLLGTLTGGNSATLYQEGVRTAGQGVTAISTGSKTLTFGNDSMTSGTRPFDGIIEYIYIWNRCLSATEALQVYESPYGIFVPQKRYLLATSGGSTASLAGGATSVSTASATLTATASLSGSATCVSTASSTLTASANLSGSATCISTASAALSLSANLSGSATCVSTASATLSESAALSGSATCVSTASATLTATASLSGSATCVSTASSTITASANLSGSATCVSTASATMTASANLSGSAACVSTASATLTVPGSNTPVAVRRHHRSWEIKPPLGPGVDASSSLSQGLTAAFLFNEGGGTTIRSLIGNYPMTPMVANSPTWTTGDRGPVGNFAAANSQAYQATRAPGVASITASGFTCVVRYNLATSNVKRVILSKNNSPQREYVLNWDQTNHNWQFIVSNDGGFTNITKAIVADTGQTTGAWRTLIVWVDPGSQVLGIHQDGGSASTNSYTTLISDTTSVPRIGYDDVSAAYFDGQIDYVCYWNRPLTAAERAQLFRNPYPFVQRPSHLVTQGGAGSTGGTASLAGSITASSTATATATLTASLAASLTASSTASATASLRAALAASILATASATGSLGAAVGLAASVGASSTASATASLGAALSASLVASSTASATASMAAYLSASVVSTASASGTMRVTSDRVLTTILYPYSVASQIESALYPYSVASELSSTDTFESVVSIVGPDMSQTEATPL